MSAGNPFITSRAIDYVVSHKDCADGALASWIVKKYGGVKFETAQYLFIKAGAKFEGYPVEGKIIMFLDNMPQNIEEIVQKATYVIIVDHHVHPNHALFCSLKQKYQNKIIGNVHNQGDKCASDLVWGFYQDQKPKPMFVNVVSTNDLWKWETAPPEYKAIWRCIFQGKTDVDFDQLMLKEDYSEEIKLGKAMLEEDEKIIQEHMKRARLTLHKEFSVYLLEGCPFAYISIVGARLAEKEECDFVAISNQEEKKEYAVSLRSYKQKADVGAIAADLHATCAKLVIKGGGHPNAAGIRLIDDPKMLFVPVEWVRKYIDKAQLRYYNEWKVYFVEVCPLGLVDLVGIVLAKKDGCDFAAISNKGEEGKDQPLYVLDLISQKESNVIQIAQEMAKYNLSITELNGNRSVTSILLDSDPKTMFWEEKHRVMQNGEEIFDAYGNRRSPTSIGCNDKFTWDRNTNQFEADTDATSKNYIYDKNKQRLRSNGIWVALPTEQGRVHRIQRKTPRLMEMEVETNEQMMQVDESSPKQV